jgi:uncharacterized damage-inducible protein DinB
MLDPVAVYDTHTKAREKLFAWVEPLSPEQYTQTFPFGLATLRRTLIHTAAAEWFLSRWLHGEPLPPITEWPFTEERVPAFADLEGGWRTMASQTRARLSSVTDWHTEVVADLVRPGRGGIRRRATPEQVAAQLLLHEVHHRAQVMAMLRQFGVPAQTLDYIGIVETRELRPA